MNHLENGAVLLGSCLDPLLHNFAKIGIHIAPVTVPLVADGFIALGLCHPADDVTNKPLLSAGQSKATSESKLRKVGNRLTTAACNRFSRQNTAENTAVACKGGPTGEAENKPMHITSAVSALIACAASSCSAGLIRWAQNIAA